MVFLAKAAEQSKREIRDNWFKKLQRNLTRYLLFSVARPSKLLPPTLNDSDSHLLALSFVSMSSSPMPRTNFLHKDWHGFISGWSLFRPPSERGDLPDGRRQGEVGDEKFLTSNFIKRLNRSSNKVFCDDVCQIYYLVRHLAIDSLNILIIIFSLIAPIWWTVTPNLFLKTPFIEGLTSRQKVTAGENKLSGLHFWSNMSHGIIDKH